MHIGRKSDPICNSTGCKMYEWKWNTHAWDNLDLPSKMDGALDGSPTIDGKKVVKNTGDFHKK